MAKRVNNSTPPPLMTKNKNWWEVIEQGDAASLFPGRKDEGKRLAYAFISWCSDKENLSVVDFLRQYRISRMTWYRKVSESEDLAYWFKEGKSYLADNRLNGAMKKQLHLESVLLGIGRLDEEVKEDLVNAADLKKQSQPECVVYIKQVEPEVITKEKLAEQNKVIHRKE